MTGGRDGVWGSRMGGGGGHGWGRRSQTAVAIRILKIEPPHAY